MSSDTLKSLTIEHLRGSVAPFTLTFEKGKKLTIIYGENGTGKSTIADALDFIGNGNVGSLDERGLGRTAARYWHSVGKRPGDTAVKLETSSGICTASIHNGEITVTPCEKQPAVKVLRRKQILNLVEARPGERYKAISQFIDVDGIEQSEASLRSLIKDIEQDVGVAVVRIQENREAVENFWVQAGSPGDDALEWAKVEAKKDWADFDNARKALDTLADAIRQLKEYPGKFKQKVKEIEQKQKEIDAQKSKIERLNDQVAAEYLEILDILQAAQRHFHNHPDPDVCPLCESAEKVAGLPDKVTERIEAHALGNQLRELKSGLSTKEKALERFQEDVEKLKAQALEDAAQFISATKDMSLPDDISLPSLPHPVDLDKWEQWLSGSDVLLQEWRAKSDEYAGNKRFIETLKASLDSLDSNSQIRSDLEELLPRLKQALEVMELERKNYTDNVLHQIATEVGRLYEDVHPGEGLNKISLELDPKKRASLEISTEFQGQAGTPPQAYFSDSHLDTLGLCIFLALAQKENPENTILVLDDVLGSVDEPHVERLIEMLYTEALKFRQCVITTHYRPWKQKLRWGWLKNGQCQFVELNKWTLTSGITLVRSIPDVERLRDLLAEDPPDPQLVCAKAGVILEAALDFLTLLYECHVPRRPNGLYTLGDLLPAIDKKLRAALRVEHKQEQDDGSVTYIEKDLAPHLDELTRIAQARNAFGCHFNAISFEMLDADAIAFGQEVLALMDCLIDEEAGWPRSNKSGSYWATSGETRRLHPLKRPG